MLSEEEIFSNSTFKVEINFTDLNETSISPDYNNTINDEDLMAFRIYLKEICDVMTVCVLMLIMFCMGTDIPFRAIINHLRHPLSAGVGMFCQFVAMPLVGFTHIRVLKLQGVKAVGVLLISCCPGGAVSNVFTYFLNGDVPLSVTMTSVSTLLALGFMPFNLWVYGQWVEVGQLVIPYKSMAMSLAFVTSPVAAGMLVLWKFPKAARYITKVGSIFGFFWIALIIALQNVAYPEVLITAELKLIIAVVTMPAVGLVIGYCSAWCFRQPSPIRKTIAVESGIQNVAIAMAVLALSKFSYEDHGNMMTFPMMYAISMIGMCFVICALYHLFLKIFPNLDSQKEVSTKM